MSIKGSLGVLCMSLSLFVIDVSYGQPLVEQFDYTIKNNTDKELVATIPGTLQRSVNAHSIYGERFEYPLQHGYKKTVWDITYRENGMALCTVTFNLKMGNWPL